MSSLQESVVSHQFREVCPKVAHVQCEFSGCQVARNLGRKLGCLTSARDDHLGYASRLHALRSPTALELAGYSKALQARQKGGQQNIPPTHIAQKRILETVGSRNSWEKFASRSCQPTHLPRGRHGDEHVEQQTVGRTVDDRI